MPVSYTHLGVKRIASVSQVVVPFMAIIYVIFVAILVITNITEVPAAFKTIIEAAFSPKEVTGGAVGSMFVAMQKGVARGIFSNEAGLGSAPIAAAAAQTKEPGRQMCIRDSPYTVVKRGVYGQRKYNCNPIKSWERRYKKQ